VIVRLRTLGEERWSVMRFNEDGSEIPIARGSEKKTNLAKDEKIKNYWDRLVDEWLKFRAKDAEKIDPQD
jgi:hypothetical protein